VHHLVETAFQKAKEVLRPREHILRALATRLIEVETMEAAEMKRMIADLESAPPAAGGGPPAEAAASA
jgi:ATP-dependent Zn protease